MVFTMTLLENASVDASVIRDWFGDFGAEFVKSGFEVGEGTGLAATVTAGVAYVKDADGEMFQVTSSATENITVTDDATNYIFLHCENGSDYLTDSTSADVPTDAMLLAVVVAASGDITSVTDVRVLSSNTNPTRQVVSLPTVSANGYIYLNPDLSTLTKVGTLKVVSGSSCTITFSDGTTAYNLGTIGDDLTMAIDRWVPATAEGYIKFSSACTGVRVNLEMY
jgi:hypothetical protein